MSMMSERWMEIIFTSGKRMRFKFPVQATDETVVQRTEEVLKLPTVTLSAEGVLYVIPTSAIQMITVTPAPKKLPRTVFRAVKLVSQKAPHTS
jgi:hypothetical protein